MKLNFAQAGELLRDFELRRLFIEEAGWDRPGGRPLTVEVEGVTYTLIPIAEKRGVQIFECVSPSEGFPPYTIRQKIERAVRKVAHEHMVIFTDSAKTRQTWQWASRVPGGPVVYREHEYRVDQSPLAMLQKLEPITFVLDDEEGLTLLDVTSPLRLAFDKEAVTKRFYDRFKAEHSSFLSRIAGIHGTASADDDREWYASLMLNRLMFIYFIQKKGFLAGDVNYLRNRLEAVGSTVAGGKFLSFYRRFLLRLFHEGLGADGRAPELESIIGDVPYLNGGLFEVHELEAHYSAIDIPDEAFAKLFDFFDAYKWHLDERPSADGSEINPDVLGYIFEQYINQKQMGAYYTKEDITEYMTRNTVVPALLEAMAVKCAVAFETGAYSWELLRRDPDRYLFAPYRTPAGDLALCEETERERVARVERNEHVRAQMLAGAVCDATQMVGLNLDVRQYLQDIIEQSEGPELIRAAFAALGELTILDPTCGSGAFLFSALGVLEPLYEACLDRMATFIDESDEPDKYADFRRILAGLEAHPSRRYFVMKRIIMDNLYGVDLMAEAAEICKLRLFLRLVAQVETAQDLEPLPDIDFNIRHGNALVGYANMDELESALSLRLDLDNTVDRIKSAAGDAQDAYSRFRVLQDADVLDSDAAHAAKTVLRNRLEALRGELDGYLASEYGARDLDAWRRTHEPFHWLIEFFDIVGRGGFNVVIGNPPYIAMAKVRPTYSVRGYRTDGCPDIYAPCMERSLQLLDRSGRFAMIVPISFQFSDDFRAGRDVFRESFADLHISTFSRNPAALFSAGLGVRSTIVIGSGHGGAADKARVHTTRLLRWVEEYRPVLFEALGYALVPERLLSYGWPRTGDSRSAELLEKMVAAGGCLGERVSRHGSARMGFKTTALYYISAFADNPPAYTMQGQPEAHTKIASLQFLSSDERDIAVALALSKCALMWWASTGDDFDVTASGLMSTPVGASRMGDAALECIAGLSIRIQGKLAENVIYTKYAGKMMGNYDIKRIRDLTDEVDRLVLTELGLQDHLPTLELFYEGFVKQTGERPGTVRELPASFFSGSK